NPDHQRGKRGVRKKGKYFLWIETGGIVFADGKDKKVRFNTHDIHKASPPPLKQISDKELGENLFGFIRRFGRCLFNTILILIFSIYHYPEGEIIISTIFTII